MKEKLLLEIAQVERMANASRWGRFLHSPLKYLSAVVLRKLLYKWRRMSARVDTKLFFGKTMTVLLPSATDIYLTGGKSHESEIRLAKFMIRQLKPGDHFLDVGAHFGYFTLLAERLVGKDGLVYSFEPSTESYSILHQNSNDRPTIKIFGNALSDRVECIRFHEFPNLYSEYNTSDIEQFKNQPWLSSFPPVIKEVEANTIDNLTMDGQFKPFLIKIDVEGSEFKVVLGGKNYLNQYSPLISLEYLEENRHNHSHKLAVDLLRSMGYQSYSIDDDGQLQPVSNLDQYLSAKGIESDNIIFRRGEFSS